MDQFDEEINENDEFEDREHEKQTQKPGEKHLGKGLVDMEDYLMLEEKILEECQSTGQQWIDKDFPADNRSLFRHHNKVPEWAREVK